MAIQSPHLIIDNESNISITRGDDVSFTVTFTENDLPVDLTGATVFFTVRKYIDNTDIDDSGAIIAKTYTNILNPLLGVATVSLNNTDTKIDLGEYKYDIQYKTAGGAIKTVLVGTFTVTFEATNRSS